MLSSLLRRFKAARSHHRPCPPSNHACLPAVIDDRGEISRFAVARRGVKLGENGFPSLTADSLIRIVPNALHGASADTGTDSLQLSILRDVALTVCQGKFSFTPTNRPGMSEALRVPVQRPGAKKSLRLTAESFPSLHHLTRCRSARRVR